MNSLQDFYERLDKADWFYIMSDDQRVYTAGLNQIARIALEAQTSPEKKALYEGFVKHHFSGKPWNTQKEPKPARPESTVPEEILEFLKKHPGSTAYEIAEGCTGRRFSVYVILVKLEHEELVTSEWVEGKKIYFLKEK